MFKKSTVLFACILFIGSQQNISAKSEDSIFSVVTESFVLLKDNVVSLKDKGIDWLREQVSTNGDKIEQVQPENKKPTSSTAQTTNRTEIIVKNGNSDVLSRTDKAIQQQGEKQAGESLAALFGISFDKEKLAYYGPRAVAVIVVGGVIYVLYKNGTIKKYSTQAKAFIAEHTVGVASAVAGTVALAIFGIYAKKYGVSFNEMYNRVTNLFSNKKGDVKVQQNA